MLKELNKAWVQARGQAAAWRRWNRKLPHNRVRRPRIRDASGRVIGYGPPAPVPEPGLHAGFCSRVSMPSGALELTVSDGGLEAAYRLARYPKATPEEVAPLGFTEAEIRRRYQMVCVQ